MLPRVPTLSLNLPMMEYKVRSRGLCADSARGNANQAGCRGETVKDAHATHPPSAKVGIGRRHSVQSPRYPLKVMLHGVSEVTGREETHIKGNATDDFEARAIRMVMAAT